MQGLCTTKNGQILITDTEGGRIVMWTADGEFDREVLSGAQSSKVPVPLSARRAIAFDFFMDFVCLREGGERTKTWISTIRVIGTYIMMK